MARGQSAPPPKVAANADLAAQLKLQDTAAQRMAGSRFQHGALDLETIETRPVLVTDKIVGIAPIEKNRATSLIEEFMVAANGVIARTFEDAGVASIRRIVRTPKRWDRIVELAARKGTSRCPPILTRRPSTIFSSRKSRKIPTIFPISRSRSSSSWAPANMFWSSPISPRPATSASPCRTTRTPPRPTAAFPTSSRSALLKALLAKSTAALL